MRIAIADIETPFIPNNGTAFDINQIFCIGIRIAPEPTKLFTYLYHPMSDGNLKAALNYLNSADIAVFHNGIRFDVPVITRLLGQLTPRIHDTFLLSKLMYTRDQLLAMDPGIPTLPSTLYGSYSLEAFGHRLGDHKGDFKDFSALTTEMLVYLKQDVLVTEKLYNHLIAQSNFPPEQTISLENEVAYLSLQQEINGFYFDIDAARELYTKYLFEKGSIERRLQRTFKPMFLPNGQSKQTASSFTRKLYIPDHNYTSSW